MDTPETILSPSEFVAFFNQTVEAAWPMVVVEGELSDFRISKNRWVYFNLVDEEASVKFFGSIYNLPGPLADGLTVRVVGSPRLHARFGFSINVSAVVPVGEGALRKAAELLRRKLEGEGLFAPERKRPLPALPQRIGLITAQTSAAYVDFTKILSQRWGGVEVQLIDTYVQGEQAPAQIVAAIEQFNRQADTPEVLVITRGGGSLDDLAAFNDERVVRAVAASRAPTLLAIGHEVDFSLAELAADLRASTPSAAAAALVPDRHHEAHVLASTRSDLARRLHEAHRQLALAATQNWNTLTAVMKNLLERQLDQLSASRQLVDLLNPKTALQRGYAILSIGDKFVTSARQVKSGDQLIADISDGKILSVVKTVRPRA